MTEPFYARRRMGEVKEAVRGNLDLGHGGAADEEVRGFLIDLADAIARVHPRDPDHAFDYVIRNMGVVVKRFAGRAYRPHGYRDPFVPKPTSPAKAPPPPPAVPRWTYPVVHEAPGGAGGRFDGVFHEFSALRMFGYTVGKTNGWSTAERRAFLDDFMRLDLPPVVEETFGDAYGAPLSAARLRKVANVIAANATNRIRHDPARYAVAIGHWEDDLAYLERRFYHEAGLKFHPWPATR